MDTAVCWKCGAPLEDIPLPLSRQAQCRRCAAELHVCRMCTSYDPRVAGQCSEDRAEDVTDKERANFCDYFILRPDAYEPRDERKAREARAQLEALFGLGAPGQDRAQGEGPRSKADAARAELERLFGLSPEDARKDAD